MRHIFWYVFLFWLRWLCLQILCGDLAYLLDLNPTVSKYIVQIVTLKLNVNIIFISCSFYLDKPTKIPLN